MKLKISKEISLPIDVVTQTLAAIGRKGSGKTYLATMIAEQMLDARAQVIVIDPVGNWWGLRVDADGKSKGKEIFVIGGDHGDVPMVPEAGRKIAKLLVEKKVSAVLDVSGFRIGEHKKFAAEFAEEFFHLKKSHRSPVHIFVEEAQKLIPQRVGPDEARMVGAFEQIIRLGRNYGIGCTLVTQRPQSVNKEVLSQVECLCVLQVTGPHERKALEEWVQEVGADRKLIGELPGLARGEGYVWSPSWLRIYERVHFSKKQTFDASATPEVGKKTQAASISAVDVEALKADMTEVIEQAEKDNPAALRKRIADLEKNRAPMGVSQWKEHGKKHGYWNFFENKNPVKVVKIETPAIGKRALERLEKNIKKVRIMVKKSNELNEAARNAAESIISAVDSLNEKAWGKLNENIQKLENARKNGSIEPLRAPEKALVYSVPQENKATDKPFSSSPENGFMGEGERKVLIAVAQHEEGMTREHLTVLTGYKRSTRDAYLQRLRARGYVEVRGDRIVASSEGIEALGGDYEPLPVGKELQDHLMRTLPEGERKILGILIELYPEEVQREYLTEQTNYQRSTRDAYIQRLNSRQLVECIGRGIVKASDKLFD